MEITKEKITGFIKKYWKRLILVFILLPILMVLLLFLSVRLEIIGTLPSIEELKNIKTPEASELYSADGTMIGKYYTENRSNLNYEEINPYFLDALISTEDVRFYKHSGVDYRSLFRVAIKTILLRNRSSGGGSTITQQLAKNTYKRERFPVASTVINKFREIVLAGKIERIYSKKDILELYANTVSFGERAFGIEIASERFYNKDSKDLTLDQAATLVGILKAPTYYSPRKNPQRALARRNIVLAQMAKYGKIDQEEKAKLQALPMELEYATPISKYEFARYFKEAVRKEFNRLTENVKKEDGSSYNIYEGGLKIYTTLDIELQIAAEKNMQSHMERLQKVFLDNWASDNMFGSGSKILNEYIRKHPDHRKAKKEGLNDADALERLKEKRASQLWTWDGYEKMEISTIDSIKHYLSLLHCSVLAADPLSGFVKVWIGGNDYGTFQVDNVNAGRQVGSTFKPIVYLSALNKGTDPCKKYANEKRVYTDYDDWTPRNSNDEYGDSLTMYDAITKSINTVSVQVLFEAGIPNVVKNARQLGIQSKLSEYPSIVLGTSDVSLYEMVNCYSHFANRGLKTALRSIVKIEDKKGKVIYQSEENEFERLYDTTHVDILNGMLHNVVQNGTARRLHNQFNIPHQVAGKTGTTQNQTDGWFIGYTPELVVGAWVGTEDRRIHFKSLGLGAGSNTALPLVGPIFEFASMRNDLKNYGNFISFNSDDCKPKLDPIAEWRERVKGKIQFPNPSQRKRSYPDVNDKPKTNAERQRESQKRRSEVTKEKKKIIKILEGILGKKKNKKRR